MRWPRCGVLVLGILVACNKPVALEPAATAQAAAGFPHGAMQTAAGVTVVASAAPWPSPLEVWREYTPIHVVIRNDGKVPVRIRWADFQLVGDDGRRYVAVSPLLATGRVAGPLLEDDIRDEFPFSAVRFRIDPELRPWWPMEPDRVTTHNDEALPYEDYWYDWDSVEWKVVRLPTREMIALGVPEGTLMPGGRLQGWLYFQDLPDEVRSATFRAFVVDATSGRRLGRVDIPFVAG